MKKILLTLDTLLNLGDNMEYVDKILEKFNFKQYESFNVKQIKKEILALEEHHWLKDTSRQDVFYTHKDTQSYFLYQTNLYWVRGAEYSYNKVSDNQVLLDLTEPIIKYLEELHKGQRGQVLFIKLPGKKNIPKHHDDGEYLMTGRRHHIPIITNKKTNFGVSREFVNMQEGQCWEINNAKNHSVENNGTTDRIHLLIDIMPNEFIKQ